MIISHDYTSQNGKGSTSASENSSSTSSLTSSSKTSSTATATPTPVSPWVDPDTPKQFTNKSIGGQNFTLVFSDEFEKAGRTFTEGDDPKWTAVDLHYWPTNDFEWYSPDAVSTSDGSMKITMSKHEINGHSYMSAQKNSYEGDYLQQCLSTVARIPPAVYLQQCLSTVARIPPAVYEGKAFQTYSLEYVPGAEGYIIWRINGQDIWGLDAGAVGPDPLSKTAQRLISEEPMSIIMNVVMSDNWVGKVPFNELTLPSTMWIGYVRVYQLPDKINDSCDPPNFPTAQYIKDRPKAYNSPIPRTWQEAGYEFPKYSISSTCSANKLTN
ncbi:hypothetical protein K7432_011266 [Basidiobolus ranarum]|uniref:GH16 domain-containing protein n=1 Tax=Basidiobolus ranarum TaxID=34480 RepID=A0ABR2WMI6_9FUNG